MWTKLLRRIRCRLVGHKYEPATLSYWMKPPHHSWTRVREDAKWCRRCGKFIVPNSKLFKLESLYHVVGVSKCM